MPKNKSVQQAYLYWMLGGFCLLGLHRFYLRKQKTAFVWMFTLGLYWALALLLIFLFKMVS